MYLGRALWLDAGCRGTRRGSVSWGGSGPRFQNPPPPSPSARLQSVDGHGAFRTGWLAAVRSVTCSLVGLIPASLEWTGKGQFRS